MVVYNMNVIVLQEIFVSLAYVAVSGRLYPLLYRTGRADSLRYGTIETSSLAVYVSLYHFIWIFPWHRKPSKSLQIAVLGLSLAFAGLLLLATFISWRVHTYLPAFTEPIILGEEYVRIGI